MKLRFDHSKSIFVDSDPLIYLEGEREGETAKELFETGWVPYYKNGKELWYQTQSARLRFEPISKKRRYELGKIKVDSTMSNSDIVQPTDIHIYDSGRFEDFFFDVIAFQQTKDGIVDVVADKLIGRIIIMYWKFHRCVAD